MLFSTLSFALGIISLQQFSVLPEIEWIVVLCLIFAGMAFFRHWRLMFFVMGMLWAIGFATVRLADRLDDKSQGQLIEVEGIVVGLPKQDERKVRFDFNVSSSSVTIPKKIRLNWYFPQQQLSSGQIWRFTVKLKKPHGRFNSNGFDYERWLFMQNIGATGYIRSKPLPKLLNTTHFSVDILREAISKELTVLLNKSTRTGLIKALSIGERNEISDKQWDVFRKTGTVHLLAISGLHIGLIAGLAYLLVLKLGIRLSVSSPQVWAAIFTIIVATCYAALAGFSLPTQRALLMLTITMLAICWQKHIKASNTIALTFLAVLIVDPLAVLSAGFWLSFLAVIIIIFSISSRLGKQSYWRSAFKIHWATAIGLSPLLLFYFQQVSFIAPLANLIAVPIISLIIVPLCLLTVGLIFIYPPLAQQLLSVMDLLMEGLWRVLLALSEIPFASISTASIPFYLIPLALIAIFTILTPKGVPGRWLGVMMLIPLVFVRLDKLEQGEMIMTVLDVGQGLSAVIETKRHALVFDTGAKFSNQYNMGDAVIIPFLKSKAIERVDMLLISHGDNDHKGGAQALIDQMHVKTLLTSVPEDFSKHAPVSCNSGASWQWDGVYFDILSPSQYFKGSKNDRSCVLKVTAKGGSVLLTGDIENNAEQWLVNNASKMLDSDVLIAPHHGSKTSSSVAFLTQVKPELVIIPAGYRNRFSFPHADVVNRYNEMNVKWLNIANEGAITVKFKQEYFITNSARQQFGKYWHYLLH